MDEPEPPLEEGIPPLGILDELPPPPAVLLEEPDEPPEEPGELGDGMLGELEDCCSTQPPTRNALAADMAASRYATASSRFRE